MFMKSVNLNVIFSVVVALGFLAVLGACSRNPGSVALPSTISTVASGYPFALQVRNQMDRNANLMTVVIDLDRRGDQFHVPQILYGFASPKADGRVFAVSVDNSKGETFALMDAPNSPDSPYMPARRFPPLDVTTLTRDISAILEIAKTNGLDQFCTLASPEHGQVGLRLFNSTNGPVWHVIGDGWDEKGPIADLAITINARTGAVLSRTLDKATNRP